MNSTGEIKLIDFGFASKLSGPAGDGYFPATERFGTLNYMAPELNIGLPYKGKEVDTFAMGVILFQLVFGADPFTIAHPENK